jgi:D-alanyl-D-alanine carboxypeptidase (penicillin-binding protein 5/6)
VASASRIDDASQGMSPAFSEAVGESPTVVRCLLDPVSTDPLPCAATILVEAQTGTVLYEQDADEPRSPASLVKMMLQHIVFRDIEEGRITLADSVETSANASTMGGSQVFLKHGEKQPLGALLQAVAISSANDAAMAIAEHVAGTEEAFVARMNSEAKRLGCTGTRFTNVHGLDLWGRSMNVTTARDVATIARALVEHEHALNLSSTWRTPFRDGAFWLDNTNRLLRKYGGVEGLDGLKTGYTWRAGGCFCGTAIRDGVRLVSVVMGARPGKARFLITRDLLEAAFEQRPVWCDVATGGERFALAGPAVSGPGADHAYAVASGSVRILVEDGRRDAVNFRIRPLPDLAAPIPAGDRLGYLDCRIDDRTFASVPVAAADDVRSLPDGVAGTEPLGGRPRPAKGVL